jgi:hypothetical protein
MKRIRKIFKSGSTKSSDDKSFHRTSEFRNGLYGTLIALAISPFSILVGFKLNEFLSRPVLSIEYVTTFPISELRGLDGVQSYCSNSTLYKEYKEKNYNQINLQNLEAYDELSDDEVYNLINKDLLKYVAFLASLKQELNRTIANISQLKASEVRISYLYSTNETDLVTDVEKMRIRLNENSTDKLKNADVEMHKLDSLRNGIRLSIVSTRLKLTILNRGSTDGLIRTEGNIVVGNKEYKMERTSAPSPKIFNAVPTYNVNPNADVFYSNSVGKIEKNTMVDFWYQIVVPSDSAGCPDPCVKGQYEIILYDQNNSKINKTEKCRK